MDKKRTRGFLEAELAISQSLLKGAEQQVRDLEWREKILQAWKDGALAIKHILETASK